MNLIEVMERFPDQEACIDHLEHIRWQGMPICPHCESKDVVRKKEDGVERAGRFNCSACKASFKVTHGTLFHGTKIPLQKRFLAIALIVNAKDTHHSTSQNDAMSITTKTMRAFLINLSRKCFNKAAAKDAPQDGDLYVH